MSMKPTPKKILDVAERLFVKNGPEATSLRAINDAAGTSQGVLHYHFGGKQKLLEALLMDRLAPIMEERQAMLAGLDLSRDDMSVRPLLAVIALPLARRMIEGGSSGKSAVKLLARLYAEKHPVHQKVTDSFFKEAGNVILEKIKAALPHYSDAQIELRMEIATSAIFSTISQIGAPPRQWQPGLKQQKDWGWQSVEELLDFLTQGFGH